MRLIDADALIDTLGISDEEIDFKEILREAPSAEVVSAEDYRSMENTCYKLQKALYEMADAPSIDIVRCRECKYAELYDGYYTQVCCMNGVIGGHGELWNPDDFCSYGEREGE